MGETVCNVIVTDDDGKSTDHEFDIVAAHTDGGNGYIGFIPANINQALECEDKEFWKAAMLDELVNHKEVFGAFGPAIPCPPGIKATPTRFLFSKKMVSADERKQDVKSLAYKQIPHSGDYERFRARLLYVNNPYTRSISMGRIICTCGR